MVKYKLAFIVILPSFLSVILIYCINLPLEYSTLLFGLIIGLINYKIHKYNPLLGILLSIILSFVSFIIAYFSFAVTGTMFSFMKGDLGAHIGVAISTNIIGPLLFFFSYTFVFNFPKTRFTNFIILLSLIILVSQNLIYYYFDSSSNNILSIKILKPYTIWQIIMALALQLILYQKEIKVLFYGKKKILS